MLLYLQAIKVEAELNASICRANLLIRYENILTEHSRFITFLKKYDRSRVMYYLLLNICLNNTTTVKIAIQPNNSNKVWIVPNKPLNNKTRLKQLRSITFKCSEMDDQTVKSAMTILKQKPLVELERRKINERKQSDEQQRKDKENRLKKIEDTLSEVLQTLHDIKRNGRL